MTAPAPVLAADGEARRGALTGGLVQLFTVALFTWYLVWDGPRLRRGILAVLPPEPTHDGPGRYGAAHEAAPPGPSLP